MKTITYNSQTLEISDEDFEQLQTKYAKKSGRFEPKYSQRYDTLGDKGDTWHMKWKDDCVDKLNYILGIVFDPSKPFDLKREKARIDLLFEVTKLYHKHVDAFEWERGFDGVCCYPFWNGTKFTNGIWGEYTSCAFGFPATNEGETACLAFANEVGIERWKKLCEYGIL